GRAHPRGRPASRTRCQSNAGPSTNPLEARVVRSARLDRRDVGGVRDDSVPASAPVSRERLRLVVIRRRLDRAAGDHGGRLADSTPPGRADRPRRPPAIRVADKSGPADNRTVPSVLSHAVAAYAADGGHVHYGY